jgi:hypothetical protein
MVFIACAALLGLASLREVCVGGIIAYVIHSDQPEPVWQTQGTDQHRRARNGNKNITTSHVA